MLLKADVSLIEKGLSKRTTKIYVHSNIYRDSHKLKTFLPPLTIYIK